MIGHVISGRYVVQAVVGTGGMAVVYRAFDKKKNRIVAIKVLRPEYESDEEFVRRFSREAEAASKVSHENIVNMLDVGIDGDMRYIVMEYVDGQTLKEMIRQRGAIHPDTAIRMAIRILAAVDHAHRNGIVHRDIKPQNIMVDNQGRVKVADFGIARLKAAQTTATEEGSNGSVLGSVHYFSPEQARGEVADEKSDLYSVGVVMYEMLTGQVPFDDETSVSVALKHVSEEPKSMRDHQEGISKALDEVVMRALCKDASKRYQTAAEMAADLRKTISHPQGGFVTYPKDPEEVEREKEERRRRRARDRRRLRKTVIAVVSVVVVLLIAAGIWYFTNTSNTYVMPDLVGQEQLLAQDALEQLGGVAEIEYGYSEDFEEGIVFAQSRRNGARVKTAVPVTLTVSLGSQWYYLLDYTGQPLEEAEEALRALGVESMEALYVDAGDLHRQRPAHPDALPDGADAGGGPVAAGGRGPGAGRRLRGRGPGCRARHRGGPERRGEQRADGRGHGGRDREPGPGGRVLPGVQAVRGGAAERQQRAFDHDRALRDHPGGVPRGAERGHLSHRPHQRRNRRTHRPDLHGRGGDGDADGYV